jgi:multiple sugar transport system substrate-binding protein
MRNTALRITAVIAGIALAVGLAGCSGGGTLSGGQLQASGDSYSGPAVKLQFWNPFTGPDGAHFQTMVDDFNKKTPKIKVTMTSMAADDLYSKLPVAVKSGNGPDVAVIHLSHVPTVAAGESLLALDDVTKSLGFKASDFAPAVWHLQRHAILNPSRHAHARPVLQQDRNG